MSAENGQKLQTPLLNEDLDLTAFLQMFFSVYVLFVLWIIDY